jgi:hypothetical protein
LAQRLDALHHSLTVAEWQAEVGEGTHFVLLEKNRMQLFGEVRLFLDELRQSN